VRCLDKDPIVAMVEDDFGDVKEKVIEPWQTSCEGINYDKSGFYVYALILWTAVIAVRSSEIFLLMKMFRQLYVILHESVIDVIPFGVIYIYMIFAIATMNTAKALGHPEFEEAKPDFKFEH